MSISVLNLEEGSKLPCSLALLSGEVYPSLHHGSIVILNKTTGHEISWPIVEGRFKGITQLQTGYNLLLLKFYDEVLKFSLYYELPQCKRFVRPIYIIAADHNGFFQGPDNEDCSPQGAVQRIAFNSKMLQMFTAEKLYEHGLGRKTFVLETDIYPGRPACHLFKTKLTYSQALSMTGTELWIYFAKELMGSKLFTEKDLCKWFTFMSFTIYCPPEGNIPRTHSQVIQATKGHTALGGGGLALFGTGNLHTWAERLEDVSSRFLDSRKIDRTKFMDDSAYRQFHWANYSTGLGASLHELGHTFDLAHTPTGVMARGFDDFYRVFTVQPPVSSKPSSRRGSHIASPLPYSPRQSPVHQSRVNGSCCSSGHSSPKPSSLSYPTPHSQIYQARVSTPPMKLKAAGFTFHQRSVSHSGTNSPVRRPSTVGGVNGECLPAVIQIETAFKRLKPVSSQTLTINNYDGSETRRTVVRHRDGTETITEVTKRCSGETVAKESVKNPTTGKMKTTMSMSTSSDSLNTLAGSTTPLTHKQFIRPPLTTINATQSQQSPLQTTITSNPNQITQQHLISTDQFQINGANNQKSRPDDQQNRNLTNGLSQILTNSRLGLQDTAIITSSNPSEHLPKSPDEGAPLLTFQQVQYKDGGAHWYRASAVLLRFHKWFNVTPQEQTKPPELKGNVIMSSQGLRLVELRTLPEGVVFHHWEFLQMAPPNTFQLNYHEVRELAAPEVISITVLAEDSDGNIFKKKMSIDSLKQEVEVNQ